MHGMQKNAIPCKLDNEKKEINKKISCPYDGCNNEAFNSHNELWEHEDNKHADQDTLNNPFECSFCGNIFGSGNFCCAVTPER